MGLSGAELQNFVKEQKAIEREDREKARKADRSWGGKTERARDFCCSLREPRKGVEELAMGVEMLLSSQVAIAKVPGI